MNVNQVHERDGTASEFCAKKDPLNKF